VESTLPYPSVDFVEMYTGLCSGVAPFEKVTYVKDKVLRKQNNKLE
jgi:hypothetical protein